MKALIIMEHDEGIARILELLGFEVRHVRSFEEAKEELLNTNFELVLPGKMLKDGSGYDVFYFLRNIASTPLLLLTKDKDDQSPDPAKFTNFAFIQWPYDERKFEQAINTLLTSTKKKMKSPFMNDDQKVDMTILKKLKVKSEQDEEVLISSFWNMGPVVLVFVRHFGSEVCRGHVKDIWSQKSKLSQHNTRIVFVGVGCPISIHTFKRELALKDAAIYTDPTLKAFAACGLKKNFVQVAGEKGEHHQLSGVVALKPPGRVVYHFVLDYIESGA